ncbi:hypothetical protein BD779DRAFT_923170 [Infundibulicybe gibba]|nr:hypothetical protein BD779DRAFT_923170 [Infundibulicybe gibba]
MFSRLLHRRTAAILALVLLYSSKYLTLPRRGRFIWFSAITVSIFLRRKSMGGKPFIRDLSRVGKLVGNESDLGLGEFDVIIVGGGTAGCVLAARLTEEPRLRVLVLESGESGRGLLFSRIPSAFSLLFNTRHVHKFYTEPQVNAGGASKLWPRAKMLGGCSSINAQMAQYGAPGDFDQWASINKDDSWSWKNFSRYFTKFEKYSYDPEYPDLDPKTKGSDGPVRIGYFSDISQSSKDFINSCTKIGIPHSADFNNITSTGGVNRIMTYIDQKRERVSSESAYLTGDVLARPNLKVAICAQVTQILFEKVGDTIRATGVEFSGTQNGPRYRARAKSEIIVAGGAVHSPQILMLSGVGPAEQLQKHNIPIIHNLPGVGSNLVDHPVVDVYFKDKQNDSRKFLKPQSISDVPKLIAAGVQYLVSQRGPLATNLAEAAAFCRSDDPHLFPAREYPSQLVDSTSAVDSPDLEIFTTPFAYKNHGITIFPVHSIALHSTLLRPMSTGKLTLKSNNPWDSPAIDPKYLEAPEDIQKLIRGIKLIFGIAKAEPLASRLDHNDKNPMLDHDMHLKSDEELEKIVRERVETLYHPTSTCRMAPLAEGGVVDPRLRVYGIRGLRVCDASIFPSIVSGHTAGAVLAVAEKLADMVKDDLAAVES